MPLSKGPRPQGPPRCTPAVLPSAGVPAGAGSSLSKAAPSLPAGQGCGKVSSGPRAAARLPDQSQPARSTPPFSFLFLVVPEGIGRHHSWLFFSFSFFFKSVFLLEASEGGVWSQFCRLRFPVPSLLHEDSNPGHSLRVVLRIKSDNVHGNPPHMETLFPSEMPRTGSGCGLRCPGLHGTPAARAGLYRSPQLVRDGLL